MTDLKPFSAPPTTGLLVLATGQIFNGQGFGREGSAVGEVCFNTAMTGYQEVLTDPSYAGQIITFTFPHIGNVGCNAEDSERNVAHAKGLIVREAVTPQANHRAGGHLVDWAIDKGLVGLSGLDTRALTKAIKEGAAPTGVIAYATDGVFDTEALLAEAKAWPGLDGMDLAKEVTDAATHQWDQTRWLLGEGYGTLSDGAKHVVAIDYGAKDTILRCLAHTGVRVTVVSATTPAADILALNPDGIFLSNGPGDPAATGEYAIPIIQDLIESGKPIYGICLGHQLLALAFGGTTFKMAQGHRGANHPVKDNRTGKVEITSMNHGFAVDLDTLPDTLEATHISLFDGTLCGLRHKEKPIFSVQQHPEASPGPQDSYYLFDEFREMLG